MVLVAELQVVHGTDAAALSEGVNLMLPVSREWDLKNSLPS